MNPRKRYKPLVGKLVELTWTETDAFGDPAERRACGVLAPLIERGHHVRVRLESWDREEVRLDKVVIRSILCKNARGGVPCP